MLDMKKTIISKGRCSRKMKVTYELYLISYSLNVIYSRTVTCTVIFKRWSAACVH